MENEKIIVGSISYAIKAKRLLAKAGVTADLIKEADGSNGCSYGLSFKRRDEFRVRSLLFAAGIHEKPRGDGN